MASATNATGATAGKLTSNGRYFRRTVAICDRQIGSSKWGAQCELRMERPKRVDEMLRDIQSIRPDRELQRRCYLPLQSDLRHGELHRPKWPF
jgi:hypothetical protein